MLEAEYFFFHCEDQRIKITVQIRNKSFLVGVNKKHNLKTEPCFKRRQREVHKIS